MKKFVNLRTPLFIAISLIIGIVFAYGITLGELFSTVFSGVLFAFSLTLYLVFSFKEGKKLKGLLFSFIFIFFALFGGVSFVVTVNNFNRADLGNHICDITGRVNDITEKDGYRKIILSNVNIGYPENIETNYKISIALLGEDEIEFGDTIVFKALLKDKALRYNGRFNVYDVGCGVKYSATLYEGEFTVIESTPNAYERVRIFIRDTLKGGLEEKEFSVVYALLTGYSDYMEADMLTNFRASGVAHIFAVSGLHIGFLSVALSFVFKKFKVNKVISAFIIVAVLIFCSGVCGFSASSLRATIMCAVMLFASVFGERYDGLTAIGTAAALLLVLFPVQLFFAGFQLSFAVVLAILVLSNRVERLFKKLPQNFAKSLSTVLVAQIASVPIMIAHFGAFSAVSIIVNLLFIPFVSFIFIFALCSALISGILALPILLIPLNYLMKAVIFIIGIIDFTVFMVGGITLGFSLVFYYASFITASGIVNLKKSVAIVISAVLFGTFVLGACTENYIHYSRCKIYSTSTNSFYSSLIDVKGERTLIVAYSTARADTSALLSLTYGENIKEIENVFILSSDEGLDAQGICTALLVNYSLENVYVYGEYDEAFASIMNKSFPNINFAFVKGCTQLEKISVSYALDGKAIEVRCEDRSAYIFGNMNGKENFEEIRANFAHFAIAYEVEDFLHSMITVQNPFSYRSSNAYKNTFNEGTLLYYLK